MFTELKEITIINAKNKDERNFCLSYIARYENEQKKKLGFYPEIKEKVKINDNEFLKSRSLQKALKISLLKSKAVFKYIPYPKD